MAEPSKNNRKGYQQPVTEKVWKDEEDSPIEQAKVHPFIKKCIQTSAVITLVTFCWNCMYLFDVWEFKMDSMFDMFFLVAMLLPPVLTLCFMHIVRTAKVRE
jgi:hypothetical protein